jgi:phage-related protein
MARRISWVRAARKAFEAFPEEVQEHIATALRIAARGQKADTAKPIKGLGSGVFEIAVAHRGDAWRAVYAVQIGEDVWVVHAFQKKSIRGIKTSQKDIELIRFRLARLRPMVS